MIRKLFAIAMILSLACLGGLWHRADASTALSVALHPEHILMGAEYNGESVTVTGKIPSDTTALIRVTGNPEHYRLKQKGRALGMLWMNLDTVEISKVPNVFLLYLPETSPDLPSTEPLTWQKLDIGLEGVRQDADIIANGADKEVLFAEFVKLKQKPGLYATVDNAVHYGHNDGTMKSFNATLALPAALPQGTYRIAVLAIKGQAVVASAVQEIDAREVGMPALISTLAFDHGTLYGVLAVLVAVIAGLLTGIMFKGEKGAH